ncbi:hypothetical protein, partial [Eubacterium aggregans]|uniref:hypothetical protein n=1 Tax=Eubacterium aggregans TaxID=81409 RepID=UPI003F35834F
ELVHPNFASSFASTARQSCRLLIYERKRMAAGDRWFASETDFFSHFCTIDDKDGSAFMVRG